MQCEYICVCVAVCCYRTETGIDTCQRVRLKVLIAFKLAVALSSVAVRRQQKEREREREESISAIKLLDCKNVTGFSNEQERERRRSK